MTLLLDTSNVAPEHRREAWCAVHRDALFPLVIDFRDDERFRGRAQMHALGDVALLRFSGDASIVRRTPRTIASSDPEHLQVALAHRGSCEVSQGGRSAVLGHGDLTTWDSSHPFSVPHRGSFDLIILTLPRALAGARRVSQTACRIDGHRGAGAIGSLLMRETWRQLEAGELSGGDADLQDALLALTRSLSRGGTPALPTGAVMSGLAACARAYALRHLGEPDLSPASIARAQHVSLRHLQAAFAREGQTVSGWLRRSRLQRISADLENPALQAAAIGSIAARWGMPNHAHMTRAFRSEFGMTPSEWRVARELHVEASEASAAFPDGHGPARDR